MLRCKRLEQFVRFGFALSSFLIVACSSAPRIPKPFTDPPIISAAASNPNAFVEFSVPLPIRAYMRSPQGRPSASVLVNESPSNVLSLTIYIEGDGAAWINRSQPPSDPTPFDPIAAALAMRDPSSWVAYLGRPCQYLYPSELSACKPVLWGNERFSSEALNISNQVITLLRSHVLAQWSLQQANQSITHKHTPPLRIRLIGYSGGGAMAALLAGERDDVDCLITLAAPLDIQVWTQLQGLSPLIGSQNPATKNSRLAKLPQTHWYGQQDRIVPAHSLGQYRLYNLSKQSTVHVLPNFDHRRPWVEHWPRLLAQSCPAS